MTTAQRNKLFGTYWPDICDAYGWDAGDRELRLDRIGEWLGREITSCSEVDRLRDFDELKAQWLAAIDPANVRAQVNQGEQPRKRLIWKITRMAPPNYTAAICRGKFGTEDLEDLSEAQLIMLRNTLAARSNSLRRCNEQPARVEPAEVAAEFDAANAPF